jgi:hypothetical protein
MELILIKITAKLNDSNHHHLMRFFQSPKEG